MADPHRQEASSDDLFGRWLAHHDEQRSAEQDETTESAEASPKTEPAPQASRRLPAAAVASAAVERDPMIGSRLATPPSTFGVRRPAANAPQPSGAVTEPDRDSPTGWEPIVLRSVRKKTEQSEAKPADRRGRLQRLKARLVDAPPAEAEVEAEVAEIPLTPPAPRSIPLPISTTPSPQSKSGPGARSLEETIRAAVPTADRMVSRHAEPPVEQQVEQPVEQLVQPVEQLVSPVEPVEPVVEPVEQLVQPVEPPVERVVERVVEPPAEQPVQRSGGRRAAPRLEPEVEQPPEQAYSGKRRAPASDAPSTPVRAFIDATPQIPQPEPEPVAVEPYVEPEPEPVLIEQVAPAARYQTVERVALPTPVRAFIDATPAAPEPVAVEPEPVAVEPEPVAVAVEPVAVEPVAVEPEPEPVAVEPVVVETEPEDQPARSSFLSMRRRLAKEPEPVVIVETETEPEPVAVEPEPEPEPVAVEPEPEPVVLVEAEPVAVEAESDDQPARNSFLSIRKRLATEPVVLVESEPVAVEPEDQPVAVEPEPEPEPVAESVVVETEPEDQPARSSFMSIRKRQSREPEPVVIAEPAPVVEPSPVVATTNEVEAAPVKAAPVEAETAEVPEDKPARRSFLSRPKREPREPKPARDARRPTGDAARDLVAAKARLRATSPSPAPGPTHQPATQEGAQKAPGAVAVAARPEAEPEAEPAQLKVSKHDEVATEMPGVYKFAPKRMLRRLLTISMLIGLVVTAYFVRSAVQLKDTSTIGLAAIVVLATAMVWAIRAGASVTTLEVHQGQLQVVQQGSRLIFDLSSKYTRFEVHGEPGHRGWKVLFPRRGMPPFTVDKSMVDPDDFMRVLRFFRPQLVTH